MKAIILSFLLVVAASGHAADLAPFTTDGCSSFPDGTTKNQTLWIHCCIRHDLAYWKGGTQAERLAADLALEQCVAKAGEPEISKLMLQGVRAGGNPLLPTPFRWGYGWPFPREYQALSKEELEQVRKELAALREMADAAIKEMAAR